MSADSATPKGHIAETALWIGEAQVKSLLSFEDAIAALSAGLEREARGEARNMEKTHVAWGGGHTLHALGAVFEAEGFAATKTWAHTGSGASPLLILFDSRVGAVRAIIEAFALGQMRTAAVSAVATLWLAAADADELAIAGTGKQALMQVRAVAAVRRLRRLRVYSPTPDHRRAFCRKVQDDLGLEAFEMPTAEAACRDAPIVTLVTRSTAPFVRAEMIARGAHVNAVGAITPERSEFEAALLDRCDPVVVDTIPAARSLSREFADYYGAGRRRWETILPLSAVVARAQPRRLDADVSLFKAMGMGISDLALGIEVYRRALRDIRPRSESGNHS